MTNEIMPFGKDGDGEIDITPTGPVVSGNPRYETWDKVWQTFGYVVKCSPWIIGWLLNIGDQRYGEMYAQAIDATGLSRHTLSTYKWVEGAVPYAEREDPTVVPWTYYKITAHLSSRERQAYIARVKSGDIESTRTLLAEVRADGNERPALPTPRAPPCPMCGETLNYDHADRHGKCKACGANFLDAAWKCEEWKRAALAKFDEEAK